MIVTIHQPDFLPWLGFFDRWEKSDLFIILDDVQFIRRGWHHRDKIKTSQGVQWLTVPVKKKGRYYQKINEVEIDYNHNWQKTVLNLLHVAYRKSRNYQTLYKELSLIISRPYRLLLDLNTELLRLCARKLKIDTPTVLSSSLCCIESGTKRLVDLINCVGGNIYISGLGAKNYLEEAIFERNGINVWWQDFQHPVYDQLHGKFTPMLSTVDYLMMAPSPAHFQL